MSGMGRIGQAYSLSPNPLHTPLAARQRIGAKAELITPDREGSIRHMAYIRGFNSMVRAWKDKLSWKGLSAYADLQGWFPARQRQSGGGMTFAALAAR